MRGFSFPQKIENGQYSMNEFRAASPVPTVKARVGGQLVASTILRSSLSTKDKGLAAKAFSLPVTALGGGWSDGANSPIQSYGLKRRARSRSLVNNFDHSDVRATTLLLRYVLRTT